jgi:hypothetical protein
MSSPAVARQDIMVNLVALNEEIAEILAIDPTQEEEYAGFDNSVTAHY